MLKHAVKSKASLMPAADHLLTYRITYLLNRVTAATNAVGQPFFKEQGLNIPDARVLITLLERGPTRAGELAQLISADDSALSHLLRRMERAGLLVRSRDPLDGRSVVIDLAPGAAALATRCRSESVRHERVLLEGLSKTEVRALKQLLEKLYLNAQQGLR